MPTAEIRNAGGWSRAFRRTRGPTEPRNLEVVPCVEVGRWAAQRGNEPGAPAAPNASRSTGRGRNRRMVTHGPSSASGGVSGGAPDPAGRGGGTPPGGPTQRHPRAAAAPPPHTPPPPRAPPA